MASFMSGMAGNVTAFNTVWTYDIYQSYIRPGQSDSHYLWMGRMATVFGIAMAGGTVVNMNPLYAVRELDDDGPEARRAERPGLRPFPAHEHQSRHLRAP